MRKNFWIDAYNGGKYLKDPNATANGGDMLDPANMESTMSGMKQGFANLIPQYVLMSWVSYFFAGFVISKFINNVLSFFFLIFIDIYIYIYLLIL